VNTTRYPQGDGIPLTDIAGSTVTVGHVRTEAGCAVFALYAVKADIVTIIDAAPDGPDDFIRDCLHDGGGIAFSIGPRSWLVTDGLLTEIDPSTAAECSNEW